MSIKSGDPVELDAAYRIAPKIVKGVYILNKGEVVVGKDFADKHNPRIGKPVDLQLAGNTTVSLKVSGIADFGIKQLNESLAFTNESFGRAALGMQADEYSSVIVQLKDVFGSTKDTASIEKSDSRKSIADWQVEQKDLSLALQSLSKSTLLIQALLIISVILNLAAIGAVFKSTYLGKTSS